MVRVKVIIHADLLLFQAARAALALVVLHKFLTAKRWHAIAWDAVPGMSSNAFCESRSDVMRSTHTAASRLKRQYVMGTWDSRPRLLHVVAARLKQRNTKTH